jgi:hypothetical protein
MEVRIVDDAVEGMLVAISATREEKNSVTRQESDERKALMMALQPYLDDLEMPSGDTRADLTFGNAMARVNFGERRTLSRELLLEAGVGLDVLERCYEVKPTTTVTVRS